MTEKLLQYIWQSQLFNRSSLYTTAGECLNIIHPGFWNMDQGPDFLNAKIQIGTTIWAGNIELHLNTSDWIKHGHTNDPRYANIILHIVLRDDLEMGILDFPTLELNDKIPYHFIQRYEQWMCHSEWIPCAMHLTNISELSKIAWLNTLFAERLESKMKQIETLLMANQFHWDRVIWILTARSFGMSKNADAFQQMAEQVDHSFLMRSHGDAFLLESLFMGALGLLRPESSDAYVQALQETYIDQIERRRIRSANYPVLFAKMRPDNFPTIRLSQLATLWSRSPLTLDMLLHIESLHELKELLFVETSPYWKDHYVFDRATTLRTKRVGHALVDAIVINVIVPMLFLYAKQTRQSNLQDRMLNWMELLSPESNSMIDQFSSLGIISQNALESQALIHLKNNYCNSKRCLECAFGRSILNKAII